MNEHRNPSITVSNRIRRTRQPKHIAIQVKIAADGETRQQAYVEYEKALTKFNTIIESLGDLVLSSAPKVPSEDHIEEEHGIRTRTKVSLEGDANVELPPSADFGALICGLVEGGFTFRNPRFEYESQEEVPPEVYGTLAAGARAKAEAAAIGAGCKLGAVQEITFPKAEALQSNWRLSQFWDRPRWPWSTGFDFWSDSASLMRIRRDDAPKMNPDIYNLLNAEVVEFSDQISISITYELISA